MVTHRVSFSTVGKWNDFNQVLGIRLPAIIDDKLSMDLGGTTIGSHGVEQYLTLARDWRWAPLVVHVAICIERGTQSHSAVEEPVLPIACRCILSRLAGFTCKVQAGAIQAAEVANTLDQSPAPVSARGHLLCNRATT